MRVLVLSFLVLALAWYFFFVYVPPGTIILRNDGFHPRLITIKAGETVTFRNERDKYFWPASDFHPSHTSYPAFDAKQPLAPGKTYSFVFSEPGLYPFHDHLAAYFFGVIKVEGTDGAIPEDCGKQGGQIACWQNSIFLALAERGVDAAYDEVNSLFVADPEFATSCHYIAHNIGLASYQYYEKDGSKILSPKAIVCAGGFYHGFMEGFLGATGSPEKAGEVCDQVGKKVGALSPDARLQCYHGIGHGAIETSVATLGASSMEGMLAEAIGMCERASLGVDERYRCVSGVYNGVANFYISKQYGLSLAESDARHLCSIQPQVYKEACYGELNSIAKVVGKGDFAKAAAYILAIPDVEYRGRAVQYLAGIYAVEHVGRGSVDVLAKSCLSLDTAYHADCTIGSIRGLYEHGSPGKEYLHVYAYCGYPGFSADETAVCYKEALSNLSKSYGSENMRNACDAAPRSFQKYCK